MDMGRVATRVKSKHQMIYIRKAIDALAAAHRIHADDPDWSEFNRYAQQAIEDGERLLEILEDRVAT